MRIRTIKPEFWSHPILSRLPADAQLLAIALLNYADDEGYFLADANLIRASCRPLSDDSGMITGLVRMLIGAEWIAVTWSDGRGPIGRVLKFSEHQVVNKPKKSKIKQYWGKPYEYGTNPEPVTEPSGIPTGGNGSGNREQGKEQGRAGSGLDDEREDDMAAKKKTAIQEELIPSGLQADPEFGETWRGFLEMRDGIKKPATELAQKILLRKLVTMSGGDPKLAIAILENSIVNSWQDVFPLKTSGGGHTGGGFARNGAPAAGQARPDLDFLPTGAPE